MESSSTSSVESPRGDSQMREEPPKKGLLKRIWETIDLDMTTVILMVKGSLAPTIAIAFYQADAVAGYFTTLGYLVPIISVLSLSIMPRAKYVQTLVLNIISACIGSAVALFGIWCGVQARLNTENPADPVGSYNSSQSAVCAIFLFANIYFVNVLRAKFPALQFPVIIFSIFTNVAFVFGPLFPSISGGEALVKQLITAFLTAFGIATGVSLLIFPISSRNVVFKESAGYIMALKGTLKAQSAYLQSLEKDDMFADQAKAQTDGGGKRAADGKPLKNKDKRQHSTESDTLKSSVAGLLALHGKLHGDLPFGKRDFAWGKLTADDLEQIFKLFEGILVPLTGMSTIVDIFERIARKRGWLGNNVDDAIASSKAEEIHVWNEVMRQLHEPFSVVVDAIDGALTHAGLLLEILPQPKKAKRADVTTQDVESKGEALSPGDLGFCQELKDKLRVFYSMRGTTLRAWAKEKGLTEEMFDAANLRAAQDSSFSKPDTAAHERDQRVAVGKLAEFADEKMKSGQMNKNRLILPGKRRLKKWVMSIGREDSTTDHTPDSAESGQNQVYLGSGFAQHQRDPEHLPPKNVYQRVGNGVRTIPHFFRSNESAFGFRVACATLTIGIVAFLKDSQAFFQEQRGVWAMIIVAIGMTVTSGQSMFGFFSRLAGTLTAAIASLVIWYIVDGKTAGVIVMLWLWICIGMYFFIKVPKFLPVWLLSIVTSVLIIGYELQVAKIGIEASSASGQPYYPTWKLAWYRLACVVIGTFVAFIWTVFPYPLTDRSWLRKDIGATIFLLANYYSIVHSTIGSRLKGTEGDMDDPQSPGRRLQQVRIKVFSKLLLILPQLKQHADWQKWEWNLGGSFNLAAYEEIILHLTNIMHYISLMSFATQTWSTTTTYPNTDPAKRRVWLDDVAKLLPGSDPTSHTLTSILSLLSASVTTGSALPPYLQLPEPFQLSRRLEKLDASILSSKHVEEPGYSAYAVLQVASSLVLDDVRALVELVKELVGETSFEFHIGNANDSGLETVIVPEKQESRSSGTDSGKGKQE